MPPKSLNLTSPLPSSITDTFTILANHGTDTWRTPPSTDRYSSPIVYEELDLSAFRHARVTVTAHWQALYDQAGLILVLQPKAGEAEQRPRWIKSGLEVVDGVRNASVVAANPYSDWSLVPMLAHDKTGRFDDAAGSERGSVSLGFERALDVDGKPKAAMWVYLELPDGKRQNLRELTWVFDGDEARQAWIGVYAARPQGVESKEPLEVEVKGFKLETA